MTRRKISFAMGLCGAGLFVLASAAAFGATAPESDPQVGPPLEPAAGPLSTDDTQFGTFDIHGVEVEYRGQPHPDVVQFNGNTLVDAPKKGELRIGPGLTITRAATGELAVNGAPVAGTKTVTQVSFNREAAVTIGPNHFDQPGKNRGWLKWLSSWTK